MKFSILKFILLIMFFKSHALSFDKTVTLKDSLQIEHPHRNALLQAVGINAIVWAYNRYIMQKDWAKISSKSVYRNFKEGWVFDDDNFSTNQFAHPYNGALVHMAARAQGLSFWQSVPYPVIGSYIWEMALETERPSINDMINTPLNGITYGEIFHRMSVVSLGDDPNVAQEVMTFIINPSLGLNRLFHGYPKPTFGSLRLKKYSAGISFGGGGYFLNDQKNLLPNQFLRFHIFYGEPFKSKSLNDPFDFFTFVGILNIGQAEIVGEFYSNGLLKKIKVKSRNLYSYSLGIYKNYDYMNYDKFKVSSSSIGVGFVQDFELSDNLHLYNETFLNNILFGGSGGDSLDIQKSQYYYGPGVSAKLTLILKYDTAVNFYLRLKRYFLFNMEDLRLSRYENINSVKGGFQFHIRNPFSICGEYTIASRKPVGSLVPEVLQKESIFRFYILYRFGNPN